MNVTEYTEPDFQTELQALLTAARGMAEGDFSRTVHVHAEGVVGELAAYINRTLHNLQSLTPTVRGSSREIPKVAQHLTEIIQTTEEATNRVLEEAEHLVAEQTTVEQGLTRAAALLHAAPADPTRQRCLAVLDEVRPLQQRSQERAMDIMAAMEFQDLTSQKIQKLIVLVAEVEARLLQLLVLFRLEDTAGDQPADPLVTTCVTTTAALCDQAVVDQLLAGFSAGHP